MDHLEILKRSFKILLKNRYLWFLGILAGWGAGFYDFYNIGPSDFKNNFKTVENSSIFSLKAADKILGDSVSNNAHFSNTFWIFISILIVTLVLFLIYITVVAKGAIVAAADELDQNHASRQAGKRFGLKDSWKFGHRFFWRRLSFSLIVFLVVVLVLSILTFPVIVLAIFGHTILAIVVGIILGLAAAAFLVYISLIIPIAERVLFLEHVATSKSFFRGSDIFRENWLNYILLYLILFGINIIVAIGLMLALVIVALIICGISVLLTLLSHVFSAIVVGILIFCVVVTFLAFAGAKQALGSVFLTLGYKSTIKEK